MKNDVELLTEQYDEILLQERFAEVLGNAAIPAFRYFKCMKSMPSSEGCPSAVEVVEGIKRWLEQNPHNRFAHVVKDIVYSNYTPKEILAELKFKLDTTLRDPSSISFR